MLTAMTQLMTYRPIKIGPKPNAAYVLANTIGFMTGAASKNVIPTDTGRPFWNNLRVTGTTPHSHTGNKKPSILPARVAAIGLRGISFTTSSFVTNASINPEIKVPNSKNATASMNMPKKRVLNVEIKVPISID